MLTVLPRLRDRLYSDFAMKSRIEAYGQLLQIALEAGYRIVPVREAWRLITQDQLDPQERYLVLRHDVDTDPRTAGDMWRLDRQLGVTSSYFFRLSTLAPALMAEIAEGGSEASYHYEELSTVAKRRGLHSRADVVAHLPEARDEFARNLENLRALTHLPMRVVASHGDFVGRRLGFSNWLILADPELRRSMNIDLETYDEAYLSHLPSRHSDAPPPRCWDWNDQADAIRAGRPVISVLVHPRHWQVNRRANARDDVQRVLEGVRFELRAGRKP